MIRTNLRNVRLHAKKHEAFNCNGTLVGDWTFNKPMTGKMKDRENIKTLDRMFHNGEDTFVIKSYETPVAAWNKSNGWWINPEEYSVTTSRHMSSLGL